MTHDATIPRDNSLLLSASSQLRESRFFCGLTDLYALSEKQALFLVVAGCKPVAEATSGHWVETAEGRKSVADDPREIAGFLESLGLSYSLKSDDFGIDAAVARTAETLQEFVAAQDAATVGRLFGYPETAVAAYQRNDLLSEDEQATVERKAGLLDISFFRLFGQNWETELRTVQAWYQVLGKYGLV